MKQKGSSMVKPDIIVRSNRRSLSLTISKSGELIVKAPKKLSLEYIFNFIQQKEKWITSKQHQIININQTNDALFLYNKFLFLGQLFTKNEVGKVKQVEVVEQEMVFPAGCDESKTITLAIHFYKQMTKEILKNRLSYFAGLMQVNYEKVSLTNAKAKWGSCDSFGNLKFNFRLAMLPHKIIDYIIIHELTHLIEFNHSKQFYKIVESIMPDYIQQKNQLKTYNFLLQLLR